MKKRKYTDTLGPINGYTFTDVCFEPDECRIQYTVHDGDAYPVNREEYAHFHFWGTDSYVNCTVTSDTVHDFAECRRDTNMFYYDCITGEEWEAQLLCEICAIVEGVY